MQARGVRVSPAADNTAESFAQETRYRARRARQPAPRHRQRRVRQKGDTPFTGCDRTRHRGRRYLLTVDNHTDQCGAGAVATPQPTTAQPPTTSAATTEAATASTATTSTATTVAPTTSAAPEPAWDQYCGYDCLKARLADLAADGGCKFAFAFESIGKTVQGRVSQRGCRGAAAGRSRAPRTGAGSLCLRLYVRLCVRLYACLYACLRGGVLEGWRRGVWVKGLDGCGHKHDGTGLQCHLPPPLCSEQHL